MKYIKVLISGVIHVTKDEQRTLCGLPVKTPRHPIGPVTCEYCLNTAEQEVNVSQQTRWG